MKAYVIKDGIFYARGATQWVDELPFASIFNKKEYAEKLKNEIKEEFDDCNPQVITLTIYEGDIKEENEFLKNFAYQLFRDMAIRESKGGLTEATIKKDFEDVLKDYKNYLQQAKESKDE